MGMVRRPDNVKPLRSGVNCEVYTELQNYPRSESLTGVAWKTNPVCHRHRRAGVTSPCFGSTTIFFALFCLFLSLVWLVCKMKNNVWILVIQKGNLETLTSWLPTQKKWFWRVWSALIYFVYDLHYPSLLSVDMAGGSILSALCVTDTLHDLSLIGAGQVQRRAE